MSLSKDLRREARKEKSRYMLEAQEVVTGCCHQKMSYRTNREKEKRRGRPLHADKAARGAPRGKGLCKGGSTGLKEPGSKVCKEANGSDSICRHPGIYGRQGEGEGTPLASGPKKPTNHHHARGEVAIITGAKLGDGAGGGHRVGGCHSSSCSFPPAIYCLRG